MVITNFTKNRIALFIGGSTTTIPSYFMIGSGSGTALSTEVTLVAPTDRQAFTSTSNSTNKVTWIGDWSSVEMSGLSLREFGIAGSASSLTGSIWSRTSFPTINFTGTNELRIEETWEVF